MQSEIIRELFDTKNGGPARAFECLLPNWIRGGRRTGKPCGAICRTMRGMRLHQKSVHGFKAQAVIFEIHDPRIEVNTIPLNGIIDEHQSMEGK